MTIQEIFFIVLPDHETAARQRILGRSGLRSDLGGAPDEDIAGCALDPGV